MIDNNAEQLPTAMKSIAERSRRAVVGRSFDHAVATYEAAARLTPTPEFEAKAVGWRARRDQFRAEGSTKN